MAELVDLRGPPLPFNFSEERWMSIRFYGEDTVLRAPSGPYTRWALEFSDYVHMLFPASFPQGLPASPTADVLFESAMFGTPVFAGSNTVVVRLALERDQPALPVLSEGPEGSLVCRFSAPHPEGAFTSSPQSYSFRTHRTPQEPASEEAGWCGITWDFPPGRRSHDAVLANAQSWFFRSQLVHFSLEYAGEGQEQTALYAQIFIETERR